MDQSEKVLGADLARLCEEAMRLGAARAVPLPASDVVTDERTLLKCTVPLCSHFGDLMCPPNTMPLPQFREILRRYSLGLLVEVPMPAAEVAAGSSPQPKYVDVSRPSRLKLHEIIGKLESLSLALGCYYAAGFTGGSCPLCDACVGAKSGLPCRHPFRARPAMEALGIDVMATAEQAGLKLSFKGESRSWVGLLLIS